MLQKYPLIGAASGVGTGLMSIIEFLSPVMEFLAITFGCAVAIVTLMVKIEERKIKSLERVKLEGTLKIQDNGKFTIDAKVEQVETNPKKSEPEKSDTEPEKT